MAYHTLAQAAKLLGYEEPKPKETKLIFDLEKGKAGYNQYLADVEAEKAAKEQASKEKKWWEKLLEANAKNYTSLPSDANASAIAFANAVNFYAQDDSYKKPSDDWTDDERWAFGEKYANNKDEAYAFAEQVNNAHAQKSREDQAQKISDWTNKNTVNKWVGSAASLGINAVAGGLGFVDSAAQQVGRGKIVRHDFLMPHEVSGKIQDTVATGLNERYGTVNFLGGERGWGDVYGLGMSIGQSTLAGVTGGSAGALVQFFGMAASQGVTDALERGATSEQALAFGTVSGLAEAIPEMISVKSLLGIASAEGVQNVFKAVAKQAGEEALEEFETSVINEVADRWIMGGKSQFALTVQELMASGMTQAQAENAAWKQTFQNLTYDVITGAASGGISGAGAASFQKVNQKYLQTQKNAEAKETLTPKVNELIEEGKKYKPTEKRSSNLEKKIAEGKEASGYELRMLASEVSKASRDADVETLRKAIVEKMKAEGLTDNQAKRLGEIALNKAIGNEVSALQNSFLKNNAAAMKVYNQMDTDNMLSGYSDSEWTKETPLAKLKAESGELQKGIEKRLNNVKTEYDQSKIVDKSGKAVFEKSSVDSKIHLDGISSELTKNNVAQLKAIEKLANELGVDIHVYETTLNENGKRVFVDKDGNKVTSNGFYDPKNKSIHIDLRAGNKGEGTMLYTASHELVHYMKDVSKEHYDALEKLVTDELIKGGKSIETLMEEQRQKARENGQNLTDDEIREEMIADACQSFLASKSAIAEIKALKTKNKSLWTALKKFFTSLFTKLDKIYKTVDPDGAEGKYIADMRNSVKNIRDAFMEGVTAAGEKYSAERKALGEGANVKVNASGEFVQGSTQDGKKIMSNARTWENGGRTTLKKTLESEGFSEGDVKAALTIMDEHMRLVKEFGKKYTAQDIANNAILTTDVKNGEAVLSAIISNGDYPVNIDLLTICKKREAYQQVINRLCESGLINAATIDSLAIAEINKILGKYGFETACLGCYVESRRIRIQEWAETIVKEWNGIVDKLQGKGKGTYLNAASETFVSDLSNEEVSKLSTELEEAYERDGLKYGRQTVVKKMEQLQREVPSMRKYITVADLITPTGRANLKAWSQELNSLINCRYGTNTPKIIQKFNPYNSELAEYGQVPRAYNSLREYLYAIGGARMQSFSDFIIENWFDYAQIVADLAARKLPMHTYTKEAILVKLFGMTGIKINMSLIPDVDSSLGKEYAGLTKNANGEYELIFADKDRNKATGGKSYMQSFNFADAIALQNDPNYSSNIGTIAIGISDKQIEMMLADRRIRMVIPYHSSGMNPIFAHLVGIKNYNDYTNDQNTTIKKIVDAEGKEISLKLKKEQIAKLTAGFQYNEALQRLGDARAAAEEYKAWCKDKSKHKIEINGKEYFAVLKPKFEQFSRHKNYYKLLADYNPYDCITEASKPQGDVTQTYPENFADMLSDELKARDIYAKKQDAKWDDAMAEINDYLETHTRADTVKYADEHGIKISDKDRKLAKQEQTEKVRHMARGKVDTYTEKEYNDFGWARANNLLSGNENATLRSLFADADKRDHKFRTTKAGEYMIPIGDGVENKIAFMTGEIDTPILTRVLVIDENTEKELSSIRSNVYAFERKGLRQKTGGILTVYTRFDVRDYANFERERIKTQRNNNQLGANRGTDSGTTQRTEKEIPQNLGHYPVVQTFKDIGGRSRKVRRLNGQYMVEGTSRKNYLYDTINEAIKAENDALIRRYASQNNKLLSRVKAEVANDPKALYGKISMNKDGVRYQARDTVGNTLTAAQQEYFKDSKVRDSKGNLMVLYHGTTADFNEFKRGDVGFHFGTMGAARGRVGYGKNVTLKEVYLNITNPIVFDDDLGSWDADYRLTRELYDRGILTQAEAETVLLTDSKQYRRTTEAANKKLAEVLLAKGYDGIEYTNTHESKKNSTSYIIFDSNQAKLITNTNPTSSKDIRYQARRASNPAPYISPTAKSIVTNIESGYKYTKMDKLKTSAIATQIAFTNAQAGIEAIAKKYGVKNIEALVQAARVATNQAEEMIGGNQYRIGSNTKDYLGEGLQKIIKPIQELGAEHEAAFYDYLFHQHNADRMSLERRSIEWNEQNKTELKDLSNKFAEIEKEQKALTDEKANLSRKQTDSKRRGEINLRLTEIKRELKALGKNIKALRQEIASFTALKNKPVIGFNHDEIEAQKAEIMARIRELQDEKKSLSKKKGAEARIKEIAQEIADLVKERSELTAEVNEEKSREIIDEYEKNYPEFVEVAEKIWNYNKNLNQYRVDTGLIDQAQFDYLNKLYPHYVPSYRSDNKTGIAAVKGKNNLAITQTVKTATGSTKDLLNPIVIMARQTMETVRAGRINQIAKALYDGANTAKDKTYLNEVSREKIDRAKLADLDPTELRPKSNQVTFFKDGERITLQVSSEIFAGFDAFSPQFNVQNPLVMAATAMNNVFKKLVTSANPVFLIRNTVRDLQDAGINTKYAKTFMINYARAANEIRKGGKLWELYRAMGGGNVSYFDFDKGFKAEQTKAGFGANISNPNSNKVKQLATVAYANTLQHIENANAFVECLPRFAEFISSLEAGNSSEQAMLDAADVTTNFARTGRITKALNSTIIPFLNPAIQGASKAIRNVTSVRSVKEAAILAAKAVLVGILPFALNSLLYDDDEDYQDLRETDKENNYLFKIGDKFIKIPRGRVAAVLAGAFNRTVKSFDDDENADWAGYLKNVSTQMNPIENMARTIFSPFMDVANNVTWYGSAIEGREFENKSPAQRYDESTSSIAIALGQVLNYSPKKIHYLLDQYSGVIGDFVLPATTKKAEKDFISGNFTIDPVTSNKLSDEFYDIYYEAQYAKNANKNDKTAEYQVKHLNRVKSAISNMYDEISKIQNSNMSDSAKLKETRAIRILINEMYKTALNDYELVTNAIEATSHVKDEYRYAEVQRLVYGSEAALKTYDEKVYEKSTTLKKAGISYDNFYKYYFGIKDIKSDKDKNGNTISGSKRKKVIEKINSLKLSEEKKLLLIAYSGYALDSEADEKKLMKYLNSLKLSSSTKENLAEICGFDYKNGKIVFK